MAGSPTPPTSPRCPHRVVILGGGFAGLAAARGLARSAVEVTVVDRCNTHVFQPLLYQVATASLSASEIAAPIRSVLRSCPRVRVRLGEALRIDPERRLVHLADGGSVPYDHLIVATGLTHDYFGHDDWRSHAPGLKSIPDAHEIRRRVLLAFERAEWQPDPALRRALVTFVIVGAGPTGVELAGALAEIARRTLPREYRNFDARAARVVLVEGQDRVLPTFPPELAAAAARQLARLGVELRLGARVSHIGPEGVVAGGEALHAGTVVWAAGVRATRVLDTLGAPQDRLGRVRVEADLRVPSRPEILVIGDAAVVSRDGGEVPGMAPAAIQEGRHAARSVLDDLRGLPRRPFRYRDVGLLATVGKAAAVAAFGRWSFAGRLAWLLWAGVHIFFLIGFRNRAVVMLTWAWAYVSDQRSARLIHRLSAPE